MSEIKVLKTPTEVLQHIDQRLAEDRFAHIQVKSSENKGTFSTWVSKARLWYDPNTCGCKKSGLSEEVIKNQFLAFSELNDNEKVNAYRILGSPVELRNGEQLIVKLP
jgi:hypothetical protein